jgi:hypothetical protein
VADVRASRATQATIRLTASAVKPLKLAVTPMAWGQSTASPSEKAASPVIRSASFKLPDATVSGANGANGADQCRRQNVAVKRTAADPLTSLFGCTLATGQCRHCAEEEAEHVKDGHMHTHTDKSCVGIDTRSAASVARQQTRKREQIENETPETRERDPARHILTPH